MPPTGSSGAPVSRPARPVDVHDLDPAPVRRPSAETGGGIRTMSGGGDGTAGGVRTTGFSGVDDPVALNRAGENAKQLASLVHTNGDVGDDAEMMAAVGSLSGDLWGGDLGVALMNTLESWDKQSRRLARTCGDIGDKCVTTAHNHVRTESANESEMNAVHASLPDFD
ncbi:hypothetical protein [Streptomyces sp. KAU_LT]|uniref:hypothetical protein n=1 Tax=Streptomyces sp. KAU_LT TaxID=3046669 RepID=UPI0024B65A0E|nr:hypothetical protein [Streptomyces sp. KAU_LT]MDI9832216.1 hypothetical protein [Streptomyces sp. KAU_LT]